MIAKIKNLFHKYYEIISYVFFGGLTTVVSWIFYYLPLFLGVDYRISKVISWVAAVVFAFFVNKHWVFLDKDYSAKALLRQGGEFFASRIATGIVEFGLTVFLVEVVKISDKIVPIPVAVITIILNYVLSKLLVFRKK